MSTSTNVRCHTGQNCPLNGVYRFDGYLDGTNVPTPTAEEREHRANAGDTMPPIRSAKKGCYWLWVRA